MANNENLKSLNERTKSEQREIARKGGKASGKARKEKRDLKKRLEIIMESAADPKVAASLSKTGIEVNDNLDVLIASMMKGVMKSNPHVIDKVLKLMDYDQREVNRKELFEIEKQKAELEVAKIELENEKQRLWIEAVKAQQGQGLELPDDGFIDALRGSAAEDWNNKDD